MAYLVAQISFFLIFSAALGFAGGWSIRRLESLAVRDDRERAAAKDTARIAAERDEYRERLDALKRRERSRDTAWAKRLAALEGGQGISREPGRTGAGSGDWDEAQWVNRVAEANRENDELRKELVGLSARTQSVEKMSDELRARLRSVVEQKRLCEADWARRYSKAEKERNDFRARLSRLSSGGVSPVIAAAANKARESRA